MVTVYLIASNVYSQVDAPKRRGFSRIDIWMVGVQFQILVAIVEYGILLGLQKFSKAEKSYSKRVDKWTFVASLLFLGGFNLVYWNI